MKIIGTGEQKLARTLDVIIGQMHVQTGDKIKKNTQGSINY